MKYSLRQIIGLIIWWTEGTKAYKRKEYKNTWVYNIDVTNTNPEIIKLFLNFLRNDIGLDESRLRLQLQIHEGDNQEEIEKFWSKLTKIPINQLTKTILINSIARKIYLKPNNHYGTVRISVRRGVKIRRKIIGWIDGLMKIT